MPGGIEDHRPMTLFSRNGSRRDETEPRQVALYPHRRQAGRTTRGIPIVCALCGDLTETGLVLAQPGGNVTGNSALTAELSGKIVDLIREVVPSVNRVAALANAPGPFRNRFSHKSSSLAKSLERRSIRS